MENHENEILVEFLYFCFNQSDVLGIKQSIIKPVIKLKGLPILSQDVQKIVYCPGFLVQNRSSRRREG